MTTSSSNTHAPGHRSYPRKLRRSYGTEEDEHREEVSNPLAVARRGGSGWALGGDVVRCLDERRLYGGFAAVGQRDRGGSEGGPRRRCVGPPPRPPGGRRRQRRSSVD